MKQQNKPPHAYPEPPSRERMGTLVPEGGWEAGSQPQLASGSSEAFGEDFPTRGSVFPVKLHRGAVRPLPVWAPLPFKICWVFRQF